MFNTLPDNAHQFMNWSWAQIQPYFENLRDRPLDTWNVNKWLADWTRLGDLLIESHARLKLAVDQDTTDTEAESRYNGFLDQIYPLAQEANQILKEKLLAGDLDPDGFAVPLRKMRAEAAIYRTENLPLLTQEHKLVSKFNKIIGAQLVTWEGQEVTIQKLRLAFHTPDRLKRERAWRLAAERQLADRQALNELWVELMTLRRQLAQNARLNNYRLFRWQQLLRLDYTTEDCLQFQEAIEKAAVPAATRVYEKHRQRLKATSLLPWDLDQDLYPIHLPPLPSYGDVERLQNRTGAIFQNLDPQLGQYFQTMISEGYLDLDNRVGKAPGGYCTGFPVSQRPFIFMNAVGLTNDVRTILHEAGHAFHNFERLGLPYTQQRIPGLEFAEVASMAMELLTFPYLEGSQGGFYSTSETIQYQIEHLEHILVFWPYMAVVDAFQHWVYTNHEQASDPTNCDAAWLELWQRYFPGVDWSGLDEQAETGWHLKQHIFRAPFYYIEYGLAQLGAVQVWRNSLQDPEGALRSYRHALRLGGTATLPALYQAAGAKLDFDIETLTEAVELVESSIKRLEQGG